MWNIEKIKAYITNEVEESLYLDYKATNSMFGN